VIGSTAITTPAAQRLTQLTTSPNSFLFTAANANLNSGFTQLAYLTSFQLPNLATPFTANLQYIDDGYGTALLNSGIDFYGSIGISIINLSKSRALSYEIFTDRTDIQFQQHIYDWSGGGSADAGTPLAFQDWFHQSGGIRWSRLVSDGTLVTHYLSSDGVVFVPVSSGYLFKDPLQVASYLQYEGGLLAVGFSFWSAPGNEIPQYRILGFSVTTP